MAALDWRPLAGVDPVRLQEARLQTHYALQWLARAAQAFIAPKPDDSHTNLGWEEEFGGFTTHKMQGAKIGLRLFPLSIMSLEGKNGEQGRLLHLDGHKEADLRTWLGETASSLGLDGRALDKPLPHKMPPHRISTGAPYNTGGMDDILRELAAWFANAGKSVNRFAEIMQQKQFEVMPARCWPHHFDLSARVVVRAGKGTLESGRSINIGFSPGDANYTEPYFYVSPWPHPPPSKLPPLPEPGRWHTLGFTAAVLPAQRILAAQGRQVETEKFLATSIGVSLKVLH